VLVFSAPPSLPDAVPSANLLATSASVRDGVYSNEQSRRGEAQYLEHCKRCHLRDLSGDYGEDAPALVGEEFLSNWANWTLGDLFDFMQTEMPPKRQDRRNLTADAYADILAFILERNGFPAGAAELPPGFEPLSEIGMGSSP
jgi:mono/diheme cytochrome c family protein